MSCTPPRTPSPGTGSIITSTPVSVIMIAKKDGTAEPVIHQQQKEQEKNNKKKQYNNDECPNDKKDNDGPVLPGRQVIFVENKNTNRHLRNANFGMEQIFVANKDTNRETNDPGATKSPPSSSSSSDNFQQHFNVSRSPPLFINAPVPEVSGISQVNNFISGIERLI